MIKPRLFPLVVALLCLVRPPLTAQADPASPLFTHEDLWLMKRVGAPVPDPTGTWVVCSVTDPSYDDKEQRTDLWIVPADGHAKPRQLTYSLAGEGGATWSPDGRMIAFSAKREGDEVPQIYLLNIAEGGEALRLTSLSTGARAPRWRPDGKALLFTSSVYPGAATDSANKSIAAARKALKYKARVYDGFPIRSWDKWLDDTKPHIFVQMLDDTAKPRDILAGTTLAGERGFSGSDDMGAIWTPDGESIVFVASTQQHKAAYATVDVHLFQIPAAGGEPRQLTPDNGSYSGAMFSPDGAWLYCLFNPKNQWTYNNNRLAKMPWPRTGTPAILTATFDLSVGSYGISPDGSTVYFLAEEAGHENLFSVPSAGGAVERVIDLHAGVYSNLALPSHSATTRLFARWESATSPAEVIAFDLPRKSHTVLTQFNTDRVRTLNLPPVREFWFTGKSGKRVHSMLVVPPGFDEKRSYPLVAMIHGGPHSMWRDYFFLRWNYHLLATPGYVILLTDYRGSTGYGETFAQDIQRDPFVGPATDIHEGIDEALRLYPFIDSTRMGAMGASYGGHMVNWLQGTTTRFKCFVSHAGLINLESQWGTSDVIYHREVNNGGPVWEQGEIWRTQNPARKAAHFSTPVLVTVGENDFRVPLNQSLEYWSYLQRLQVPSRLIVFPDENHWIMKGENSRFFYGEVHAWLKKHLGSR